MQTGKWKKEKEKENRGLAERKLDADWDKEISLPKEQTLR